MRAKRSRPSLSVPKTRLADGGAMEGPTPMSNGLCATSSGAATANKINAATINPPTNSSGLRASTCQARITGRHARATPGVRVRHGRKWGVASGSTITYAWVGQRVEQVCQEIDDHHPDRGEQEDTLHQRIVAQVDACNDQS